MLSAFLVTRSTFMHAWKYGIYFKQAENRTNKKEKKINRTEWGGLLFYQQVE